MTWRFSHPRFTVDPKDFDVYETRDDKISRAVADLIRRDREAFALAATKAYTYANAATSSVSVESLNEALEAFAANVKDVPAYAKAGRLALACIAGLSPRIPGVTVSDAFVNVNDRWIEFCGIKVMASDGVLPWELVFCNAKGNVVKRFDLSGDFEFSAKPSA